MKLTTVAPAAALLALAAGVALGPVAVAGIDPCTQAVGTSRCDGPNGYGGSGTPDFGGSSPANGVQNGPYGPSGSLPPVGNN